MQKCFWLPLGIVLATLGLTACAAPAATPFTASPVSNAPALAQNEIQTQVTLISPVIAGSNPITVQLRDIKTGKPLHDATVRVAVVAQKQLPTQNTAHAQTSASDDHGNTKKGEHASASTDSHANTNKDAHETAKPVASAKDKQDSHQTETKTASHADKDAGHAGKGLTAGKTEGEYRGQVVFPNAGDWLLTVTYEIAGKEEMAQFAVNATRSQETWLVLSGFLGINLAVIATAGITKRKALKK